MPLIDFIDGPNRNIYLHLDTVGVDLVPMDIYKEMRVLRESDENLRKFNLFISGHGREEKGAGKYTERYIKMIEGTRIVPYDTTHELTVIGTMITDDGQEGIACFDRTPLSPSTIVDINYIPPQVEIIEIEVGSSALTPEENEWLSDIRKATVNNAEEVGYETTIFEIDGTTVWKKYDTSKTSAGNAKRIEIP